MFIREGTIMRTSAMLVAALASAVAPVSGLAEESSIACGGGIVQVGDTQVDLLGKCGEPALKDVAIGEAGVALVREKPLAVDAASTTTAVERWTFNFGPNRFVQVVTIEAGRVVRIERGSYGYDPERVRTREGGPPCDSSAIQVGHRKLALLARCGPPTARDVRREKRTTSDPGNVQAGTVVAFTTVEIETWTYDLGPNRFITIATLEDGRVTAVEHGGYGYRR
jgi:hypothetical protein